MTRLTSYLQNDDKTVTHDSLHTRSQFNFIILLFTILVIELHLHYILPHREVVTHLTTSSQCIAIGYEPKLTLLLHTLASKSYASIA